MNPVELIIKSVENALIQEGYTGVQARIYAKDAANYYRNTSTFKNGAYAACLAFAKKAAKQGGAKNDAGKVY